MTDANLARAAAALRDLALSYPNGESPKWLGLAHRIEWELLERRHDAAVAAGRPGMA